LASALAPIAGFIGASAPSRWWVGRGRARGVDGASKNNSRKRAEKEQKKSRKQQKTQKKLGQGSEKEQKMAKPKRQQNRSEISMAPKSVPDNPSHWRGTGGAQHPRAYDNPSHWRGPDIRECLDYSAALAINIAKKKRKSNGSESSTCLTVLCFANAS